MGRSRVHHELIPPPRNYAQFCDAIARLLRGQPLLHPEHPLNHEIVLGDVGFVSESGYFIPLFNVMTELSPNKGWPAYTGTMDYDEEITGQNLSEDICRNAGINVTPLRYIHLLSKTTSFDTLNDSPKPGDEIKIDLDFESGQTRKPAAFVACQTPSIKRTLQHTHIHLLMEYMRKYVTDWYTTYTADHSYNINRLQDLILVTGWRKTKSWAIGFFPNQTSLKGRTFKVAEGCLSDPAKELLKVSKPSESCYVTVGPREGECRQEPDENKMNKVADQAVCINGFRARNRFIGGPRPTANAGPYQPPNGGRRDHDKGSINAISVSYSRNQSYRF